MNTRNLKESFGGIALISAAVIALIWANSPAAALYESMIQLEWIKGVAIFLFFMSIGIELRHEIQHGSLRSARNAIVIFTSNLGAADMEKDRIGFGSENALRDEDTQAINKYFTPEFRNRLDAIVRFNSLAKENMEHIIDKFINQMNDLSAKKNVNIICDPAAKQWLIDKGFDKKMGARPLSRVIAENIKKPISREMLFGKLRNGGAVMISVKESQLVFDYLSNPNFDNETDLLLLDASTITEV